MTHPGVERNMLFDWSGVLDTGTPFTVAAVNDSDLVFFRVELDGRTFEADVLAAAEVKAWKHWHASRDQTPASVTGDRFATCPACEQRSTELGENDPVRGIFYCTDRTCAWSEWGFLTLYGTRLLGQPWPRGSQVTIVDTGRSGRVRVRAVTLLGDFEGESTDTDLAEHEAFLRYAAAVDVANVAAQIAGEPRMALLKAC